MSGAVVFDLDGTLIDSAADIQAAANAMLGDFGAGAITRAQTVSFIGRGAGTFTKLALEAVGATVNFEIAQARFRERYAAQGAALASVYPGALEALDALSAAGMRLGLCTNKPQAVALEVLETMDLARWFDVVVGAGADHPLKPDPAGLRACFAALDVETGWYVGDSETDARTAAAAACPFALYTEGYRHGPVEAMAPDFAFDDFMTLPPRLLTA
jgi:phosphoglycolate phosphatase